MDPAYIGAAHWSLIVTQITGLLLFLALLVGGALAFLLGHAVLPSLYTTGHLDAGTLRLRPVLYAVAIIAVAAAIWQAVSAMSLAYRILYEFYPRFWI